MSEATLKQQGKRIRTLTPKGMELFQEEVVKFHKKLENAWHAVEIELDGTLTCGNEISNLQKAEREICIKYGEYRMICKEYVLYLNDSRTDECDKLLDEHNEREKRCDRIVQSILGQIDIRRNLVLADIDNRSTHSGGSRGSRTSSRSSGSVAAKAKAEAAKARIAFAEKEKQLRDKQAIIAANAQREKEQIEAELGLLQEKKLYAEAAAEVEVFETVDEWRDDRIKQELDDKPLENPFDRTKAFVMKHATSDFTEQMDQLPITQLQDTPQFVNNTDSVRAKDELAVPTEFNMGREFGRFLVKKDLMMSRLSKFQDDPLVYNVWKSTFLNVTEELSVTPIEEMELLIKWLGPESTKQAMSLRSANSHDPGGGLRKIWDRLDERYGAPEHIENILRKKVANFPRIGPKENKRLYELSDILSEIESRKQDSKYSSLLAYYDSSMGVNPVVSKLPTHVQNKWTERARSYKKFHDGSFPPFTYFVDYIREMSVSLNDPSFQYDAPPSFKNVNSKEESNVRQGRPISTRKTEVQPDKTTCPLHPNSSNHTLNDCREFRKKPIEERRQFLKDKQLCFRCCNSDKHQIKDCKASIRCKECDNTKHTTALHIFKSKDVRKSSVENLNGRESSSAEIGIKCKCTEICGDALFSKSCAKIVKVCAYPKGISEEKITFYALIDDQSNRTMASPEFFDRFKDTCTFQRITYSLSSLAGNITATGRKADEFVVESLDGTSTLDLPTVLECYEIPNNREEIPTPNTAIRFPHLKDIAQDIPVVDEDVPILMLIGRDLPEVHHVLDQRIGPTGSPYGQKLNLGWVIVGETCLGGVHLPHTNANVFKTFVHKDGRQSIFPRCENKFVAKNKPDEKETDIFQRTSTDEKIGTSIEDRAFLNIMDRDVVKDTNGHWVAPLPFRSPGEHLPNNRAVALKRAKILDSSLRKNPIKQEHFITFMSKVLDSGAAEVAPPPTKEVWYLPIFGVYHPKKLDRIRGVFDSSATCGGVSLNSVLLSGPNLTNNLLGILLRFRKDAYAITGDIEQMFYSFLVQENHRDFLRFLWYKDNDPEQQLIEYRMCAHVFGNSPSPAVATYCLRKSVEEAPDDIKDFVNADFYVDDALTSRPSVQEAVSIMKQTQEALKTSNLRLHKIASNSHDVMRAFPEEDLEKDLKSLNFDEDPLPTHQSLGLAWDLNSDSFKFNINIHEEKAYTRRGLLSTLNSIYDPIGFVAPITIQGKILLRQIATGVGWDDSLEPELVVKWKSWTESLKALEQVSIPRMYVPQSLTTCDKPELHIFSDASEKAVSAVGYLVIRKENNTNDTGFVMGKTKLSPKQHHTIPRLELCAALLAAELGRTILETLKVNFKCVNYYTDSKVVLGYINNKTRRFHNYVSNRVEKILHTTAPDQWRYVNTKSNPADLGSRGCSSLNQLNSWITGPDILDSLDETPSDGYPLVSPNDDTEVRQVVNIYKSAVVDIAEIISRFSKWRTLVRFLSLLKRTLRRRKGVDQINVAELDKETEQLLIKLDQKSSYGEELKSLSKGESVKVDSRISALSPFMDNQGIIRVGGRSRQGCLSVEEKNPVILSSKSRLASLIVQHFHENCKHQGRLLTEGTVRNNGFWIVGAKRLISDLIHRCVICRKLRGIPETQKKADLPVDRITPGPPFTSVGVDVFGPWSIVSRRTRGGVAQSKRWAALFTCMSTRAVHIEVLEEMSSSSFINALRRFIAIRGNVKEIRSDRGTNFVGAAEELKVNVINVEDGPIPCYLRDSKISWRFNAPHSSHMGGVWERMIGIARKILDAMLLETGVKNLTHEVIVTLMAEVSAIMN